MVPAMKRRRTKNSSPFPTWFPLEPPRTSTQVDVHQVGSLQRRKTKSPLWAKGTAKRKVPKTKRKQKMRAPDSTEVSPSHEPLKKNQPRDYAPGELDSILSRMELARHLERDPILHFLHPKLLSQLTGPVTVPDVTSLTKVRRAVHVLFAILRDAGYVLGAFEIERVYDWDVEAWKQAIGGLLDPLGVLVGVKGEPMPTAEGERSRETVKARAGKNSPRKKKTPPVSSTKLALFVSSEDSDSSVESSRRMPMPSGAQRDANHPGPTTAATRTLPGMLEDAIVRLMQTPTMRAAAREVAATQSTSQFGRQPATPDVTMESVSSHSSAQSARHYDSDEDADDLFDLETHAAKQTATVATATTGAAAVARVRMSAFSELKEFHGRDSSEEKARAWLNRVKSAARRDGMTGEASGAVVVEQFQERTDGEFLTKEHDRRLSQLRHEVDVEMT
jgi:hypothetical protein